MFRLNEHLAENGRELFLIVFPKASSTDYNSSLENVLHGSGTSNSCINFHV